MNIKNILTPRVIDEGIDDQSTLQWVSEDSSVGQFAPKFFIKAERGPHGSKIMGSNGLQSYGSKTFTDPKYVNHQTILLQKLASKCTVIVERIDMDGVGANLCVYVDVARVKTNVYKRDDGIATETSGFIAEDVDGLKLRLVTLNDYTPKIQEGSMLNEDGTSSTMYPIFYIKTDSGSSYNEFAINIQPGENDFINKMNQFVYDVSLKQMLNGVIETVPTKYGSKRIKSTLTRGLHPITNEEMNIVEVFNGNFQEFENDSLLVEAFDGNIGTVCRMIAESEANFLANNDVVDSNNELIDLEDYFDTIPTAENIELIYKMFNPITAESSTGHKYFTVFVDPIDVAADPIKVHNRYSNMFFSGGIDETLTEETVDKVVEDADPANPVDDDVITDVVQIDEWTTETTEITTYNYVEDGVDKVITQTKVTVYKTNLTPEESEELYNSKVKSKLAKYTDELAEEQDLALHPESVLVDTGWPLDVKLDLIKFITLRGDTMLLLSTAIYGINLDIEEQMKIAYLLKASLLLAPESTVFSTDVGRATIVLGDGVINNTTKRVPLVYDLAVKCADYMGGAVWTNLSFDAGDESVITTMHDIEPKRCNLLLKDDAWGIGVCWANPLKTAQNYAWSPLSTVASEMSGCNSLIAMFCAANICREEIWTGLMFEGESRYTEGVFLSKVTEDIAGNIPESKYDNRFSIQPIATIDSYDAKTGGSWHLETRIGVNNFYTVVRLKRTIYRKSAVSSS